ncbi:hypothetical protein BC830DRAFT_1141534 [Chytriomyces sp. MP71]|nr:hypothetical protein BC830DRAFT_1141534 [Chytriomyces sp. MP71]
MSSVSSASHGSSSGTMIASLKVKQDLKEDGEKVKSSRQWHMRTILLDATHISIYPKSTPFSTSKHVIPLAKAPIAAATAARLPHYKARYTTAHTLFRVTFLTGASWLLECKTDLDCVSWIHAINTAALRAAESGVASLGREILSLRSDIVRSAGWPDASGTADIQRLSLDTQRWIASLSTKVEALQQELRLCRKYLEKEGGEDARQLVRASYQTSGCHSRAWSNGSEQSNSLSWGTESVKSVCPSIVPSQTETVGSKRVPKNTLAGITGSTASRRPVMERKYSPQLTYGLDYRSATATRAIVLIQQSKRGTSLLDVDTSTVEPCEQQAATSITPLVHQPTPLREEDDQNEQTAPSSSFAMQLKSVKLRNVSGTSSATSSATTQTQATLGAEARSCSESTLSFSEEIQRLQLRPVSCSSVQPTAISRDIATASRSSSAVSHSMADEIKNTRLRRTADETIMHSQPGEYHGRSTGLVHTEHGGVKPPICESILEKTQDVRLEAGCGMKECSDDQERANGNLSLADQILRVKLKRVKPGETDISMRTSSTNVTNDKMRRLEVDGMLNVRKFQPESRPQRLETSTPLSLIEEIGRIQLRKVHSMVAVTSEECSRAHEPMPPATSMSPQRPQIWRMQSSNATLRIASEVELSANKEEKVGGSLLRQ